jgi:hypothetical protein
MSREAWYHTPYIIDVLSPRPSLPSQLTLMQSADTASPERRSAADLQRILDSLIGAAGFVLSGELPDGEICFPLLAPRDATRPTS